MERNVMRSRTRHHRRVALRRRLGVVALLAMLYLILIAALAVGFYEATTMSSQISNNDTKLARSYTAAESGMNFMRMQMKGIGIPKETPASQLFDELYIRLGAQLNTTDNMPKEAKSISQSADHNIIYIPAKDQYIATDISGSAFRCELDKQLSGERVTVQVFGKSGTVNSITARGIQMDYVNMPNPTTFLNY